MGLAGLIVGCFAIILSIYLYFKNKGDTEKRFNSVEDRTKSIEGQIKSTDSRVRKIDKEIRGTHKNRSK